ncbi:MAG: AmmeMemoRadiSam system radical SAM enzyme [Deltaproteobacteria bacterium]|nr:AmmeMemoRadiSam system radical SAM enzyme [Deltaproteobacteria bacterium]
MKEAFLYEKLSNNKVQCRLCNHFCVIDEGHGGLCGVRENRSGTLLSLVHGKIIAGHCDPIEKKPLFHFLPGSLSYSIATVGCNFRCLFCQNADISQMPLDQNQILGENTTPEDIVQTAIKQGATSISYTYTEPTIYFETAFETARIASDRGLLNVFVSNGYMTPTCLEKMGGNLAAANVDLKAFNKKFYREQCGAKLEPVLKTLETLKAMGVWLEVTTLLIPGLNDKPEELKDLARFLVNLDPGIPWHISRFHPTYRLMHIPSTPVETIQRARDLGYDAGLQYVYTGNIHGDEGENTFCHSCKTLLINRTGFFVNENRIENNRCTICGKEIPGRWNV